MNTTRSKRILARHQARSYIAARTVREYERVFTASPEELFGLLCPTREADWIPGWTCDLVYSTTGYAEPDCIFTTGADNPFGPGTWVMHTLVPGERLEIVKTSADLVLQIRITVSPVGEGRCRGHWRLCGTGLSPLGNEIVSGMADQDGRFVGLLGALEHYLVTGSMIGA
jgi:hypothetical protein